MAEASTLLSSGLVTDTVLKSTEDTMARLAAGAKNLLHEPELARSYRVLAVAFAAGMTALVEGGADLMRGENERG